MEKYETYSDYDTMSRTKRNEHIYNSTDMSELSRIKTNNNVSIISDGGKTVDLEKIKKYISSINDSQEEEERRKITIDIPVSEEPVVIRKVEKDYDINSVLEKAREKQERDYEENRHRKVNTAEVDILKSIKIKERYNVDSDSTKDELNTEEKTIVDLIQNIQNNSKKKNNKEELFADLMGDDDDTVVMGAKENDVKSALLDMTQDLESIKKPENDFTQEINFEIEKLKEREKEIEEEKNSEEEAEENTNDTNKVEIDKSFYTNSVAFDKSDFEGFEDLEESAKKSSIITKLSIVLVILLLLATIFIIANFVFDLNII